MLGRGAFITADSVTDVDVSLFSIAMLKYSIQTGEEIISDFLIDGRFKL